MPHYNIAAIIGMDPVKAKRDLAWLRRKDDEIVIKSLAYTQKLFSKYVKKYRSIPKDVLFLAAELRIASNIRQTVNKPGIRDSVFSSEDMKYSEIVDRIDYAKPKRKRLVSDFMESHASKILTMHKSGYSSRDIAHYFSDSVKFNITVSHTSIAGFIRNHLGDSNVNH